MTLMESPFLDSMMESPSGPHLNEDRRYTMSEMMALNHSEWRLRLADGGFSEKDVNELEALTSALLDEVKLSERLREMVQIVPAVEDDEPLKPVLTDWMSRLDLDKVWQEIKATDWPDEFAALGHATRHLWHIAESTIWFERTRRIAAAEPTLETPLSQEEIKEGIELAEAGIALDAKEWPAY